MYGMKPIIRETPLTATLIGASGRHDPAKSYGAEIIGLLNRVWPVIKGHGGGQPVPNTGINWAVYGEHGWMFAGVEADVPDAGAIGLERTTVRLTRYAEWKHIGPYGKLAAACEDLHTAVAAMGFRAAGPLVEVYGHWTQDESKLETTILLQIE